MNLFLSLQPSAPIIEEWDIDNDNDSVFRPKSDQTKPKFTKINFVKSGENVKSVNKENTHRQVEYPRKSQSPKVLNNKGRVTGQREIRPLWNNDQRVNHQNKLTHPHPKRNFVPTTVVTKSGQAPVNAAKQSSPRVVASISTDRPVNTVAPKPKVNDALPTSYSYFQTHSPVKKPINKRIAVTYINFNKKINTAKVNNVTTAGPKAVVSTAEGNRENAANSSQQWLGSLRETNFLILSAGYMTGNKSFLTDYQEIDGEFFAFGGSPKGDKTGLSYDSQINESELNNIHKNESEVIHSVFNNRESDVDDNPVNDRFKIGKGFHAVPPFYIRNHMPARPDLSFAGLDESVFKSAVRKTTTSVPETETSISKTSKDIIEKPKTVRPSAPIIEEWDTDNDNDSVFRPKSNQTKPKFTKINFVKSSENVKFVNKENTHRQVEYPKKSQSPRRNRRNWNGMMTQKLGNGFEFIKKACFVCRIFNHLIKDCDFHDNKMVEKPVLNNKGRVTGQREIRPVWNNAQRVNHQNKLNHPHPKRNFVPTAVARKSGQVPVNADKQSSTREVASISIARPVDTAAPKPKVNDALPTSYSYFHAHSPVKKPINKRTAVTNINFNKKINTAKVNNVTTAGPKVVVSAAEGNGENAVKSSPCWIWRPTGNVIDHISKDSGSTGNPQYTLQDQGIFDSGCSRHMTINKSFLTNYQEIDGGFVAFAGSAKGGRNLVLLGLENQINHKVKIIRCDNGTEFKNNDMNQFCGMKGIKREFSVARTPQQNGVAERKNRTLIEAARTMLADSLLPTTFWAEAVNTACYVQNRVLVTKPHNKTPYELLHGRPPSISFMRPFGCPVTILNTLDPLGKFDGKADEGFLVGYSINSKAFRVFNTRTRKVEENLHITFLENKLNVAGSGPDWLFDIDLLTNSMNYEPVTTGNQTNGNASIKDNVDADAVDDDASKKTTEEPANKGERNGQENEGGASNKEGDQNVQDLKVELDKLLVQQKEAYANSTNRVSTVSPSVSAVWQSFINANNLPTDPLMPDLEDTTDLLNTGIFSGAYDDEDVGAEVDLNNLETTMNVSPIPTTRIRKYHPKEQIIGDPLLAPQTRKMTLSSQEHAMVSYIKTQRRTNHKDYQNCLFACFLSQIEPKKVTQALTDPSWIEAMQDELLQFRLQKVYRNKKDERGIVVRNKARLVAQGYTQEEGIDYDKVFAPVARIEAIRLFLAYASFMGFIVYQMDVKSAFLYGTIEEEVYVYQPPGFEDPRFPNKIYKVYVDDIIFGSTKNTLCVAFEQMMHKRFQMSYMGELTFFLGLQVQQRKDIIFISQDKYVVDILKNFDFVTVKTATTPMEPNKALVKDEEAENVNVHLYKSMIGSLMYLTAFRPDIM
ncbi:putative ribonuclease H-like domain-containing protein, partial [Tanacetum coccineum]